jgi:hypothetical protein
MVRMVWFAGEVAVMPVKITCPHCRHALRLPDPLYDRPAQCPLCHGAFIAEWKFNPRALPSAPPAETVKEEQGERSA